MGPISTLPPESKLLWLQGLKARTNTMVEEVNIRGARGKGKAKGGGRNRGGGGEGDELAGEGVAGDVEGGAALAEEAAVPEGNGQVGGGVVVCLSTQIYWQLLCAVDSCLLGSINVGL